MKNSPSSATSTLGWPEILSLSRVVVEQIRAELGLKGLDHHLARQQFQEARERSEVILTVYQQSSPKDRATDLLAAGSRVGLWGQPWLWNVEIGQRLSLLGRIYRALRAPPEPGPRVCSRIGPAL